MRTKTTVVGLFIAASAWLASPLCHAATLLPDDARARAIETDIFATGSTADPSDIDVDESEDVDPTDSAGLARGGKNAHKKVPASLHSSEWKHTGSGGRINHRKAARYANDPHKKRKAEISLTKQQNKRQRKGHRKNADGTYKTQVRLDGNGQKHFFGKR